MANADEHVGIQSIINTIIASFTLNPLVFIIAGIIQHWILDNLINERPINVFTANKEKESMSITMAIMGVTFAIYTNTSMYAIMGLIGSVLPDIMEGIRLLMGNTKEMWMKGDNGKFHVDLGIGYLFDSRNNHKKDITRRLIILLIVVIIQGVI